jgi:hypothetical protein
MSCALGAAAALTPAEAAAVGCARTSGVPLVAVAAFGSGVAGGVAGGVALPRCSPPAAPAALAGAPVRTGEGTAYFVLAGAGAPLPPTRSVTEDCELAQPPILAWVFNNPALAGGWSRLRSGDWSHRVRGCEQRQAGRSGAWGCMADTHAWQAHPRGSLADLACPVVYPCPCAYARGVCMPMQFCACALSTRANFAGLFTRGTRCADEHAPGGNMLAHDTICSPSTSRSSTHQEQHAEGLQRDKVVGVGARVHHCVSFENLYQSPRFQTLLSGWGPPTGEPLTPSLLNRST